MQQQKAPKIQIRRVHTVFLDGVTPTEPVVGRHYTLTQSDRTGDMYVSIGLDVYEEQISGAYTRYKRDEIVGEWKRVVRTRHTETVSPINEETAEADDNDSSLPDEETEETFELHLYVHISGGRVLGRPGSRNQKFVRALPRVIAGLRYADNYLCKETPELDDASVFVHFESHVERYNRTELWGKFKDYYVQPPRQTRHR